MRLDRYLAKSRIIDLESNDLREALDELLEVAVQRLEGDFNPHALREELLQRETTMPTYLGNGVAMPHLRVPIKRNYIFAIGRAPRGLEFQGSAEYSEVRLVVLLLAAEKEKNYLNVLASLARLFRERTFINRLNENIPLEEFRNRLYAGFRGLLAAPDQSQSRFNRLMLRNAEKMAKATKCAAIVIFSDTFVGGIEATETFPDFRIVIVTRAAADRYDDVPNVDASIEVRAFSTARLSQARSAVIIGLTRGIFTSTDRLCCVGGLPNSNQLDALVVVDVGREFQSVFNREDDLLPKGVKIEVIERILAIATELAVEGREGKPVGSLFVLGDDERVSTMIKPLILNPFYGYKEEDRNVLNPFMDETVKELSVIDGCFVIRGNGVIESAGSLIHTPAEFFQDMPGGFGARHSAAAAISRAADCIAVVVSASTGQVTLFRRGVMVPLLEKSLASA